MPGRLVVVDAGPLHYLILIGQSHILPLLFEKVFVPTLVRDELAHSEAPVAVREWVENPPGWLEVQATLAPNDPSMQTLDDGERSAIALALSLGADLILMDDRAGVAVARARGFPVTGTLGLLDLAARRRLLKLSEAFARLKTTNFRYPPELMDALLAQAEERKTE
jgi:predicted nucleic acid-binding protein